VAVNGHLLAKCRHVDLPGRGDTAERPAVSVLREGPKSTKIRSSSGVIQGIPDKKIARQKTWRQTPNVGWHFFEGGFDAQKAHRDNDDCHGRFVRERGMDKILSD
jgi:hypothetical protein